jgi:hypothetical protein
VHAAIADFGGDGIGDLAYYDASRGGIFFLHGIVRRVDPTAVIELREYQLPCPQCTSRTRFLAPGNVTGDRFGELVVVDPDGETIAIVR